MEPDIMPLHSACPPLNNDDDDDDDDDVEEGSEEDEFGDFGGFSVVVSCSPLGFAHSPELPSSLRQPSPPTKPATCQPYQNFSHPVEQSQPVSIVSCGSSRDKIDIGGQGCDAGPSFRLSNGYAETEHTSGSHFSASLEGGCSPKEETGFADFTVFTDQAAHPWCCGFSPIGTTEQWGGRVEGTNLAEKVCDARQQIIMDSEPRSHGARKIEEDVSTKVKHCEKDSALKEPSQDYHQPQVAAAALAFQSVEPHLAEEEQDKPGDSWKESGHSLEEPDEERISNVPQTFSVYESASGDLGSFCDDDDLSFEGVSADLEPNVSSLTSEDPTDWDKTDVEDEDLGLYRHSDSPVNGSIENLRQSEAEKGFHHCHHSATQETPSTSKVFGVQSHIVAYTDESSDFSRSTFEHQRDQEHADVSLQSLGRLPPSDSFADFCSAPTQEDGDGLWAQEEAKAWTQFREKVSSLHADGGAEDDQGKAGQYGVLWRNSCQATLSFRVQQLLQATFPDAADPATDSEEALLSLDALLQTQHLPEREAEEKAEHGAAQWIQRGLWWPRQDVHSAIGLQFQWGGSHTNRTLLRCLGVDTRNIVFAGMKKQPVAVPAFASGLGLLEPTKDFVPAVRSPQHTAVTTQTPPGTRDIPDPSTHSVQEALPSSQLDWSSHGLSSSQDGMSPRRAPHFWGWK